MAPSVLKGPARILLASALGHFTALSGAASGRALGRAGGLDFAEAAPLVAGASGEGVGAAVHHPGVQAIGHGERLEVASQGHGEWELVHQVHRRAGHHGSAAQVLQAQYLAGPPQPVHPMPQQHRPGQLREGLGDVEVAQRADLEEGHSQALRVGPCLLRGDLPLEGQVQAVPHQDFRDPRGVLAGEGKAGKTDTCTSLCCWPVGVLG